MHAASRIASERADGNEELGGVAATTRKAEHAMRKRSSTLPVRVFCYALLPPISNAELVAEQMRLAERYRTRLLEIELERRTAYRSAMRGLVPQLDAVAAELLEAQARLQELRSSVARAHRETASRSTPAGAATQVKAALARLKELRASARAIRSSMKSNPLLVAAAIEIDKKATLAKKKARANSGLYSGTYIAIEMAVGKARASKRDPNPSRRRASVRLSVQKHLRDSGGIAVDDVMCGRSRKLRIDALPESTWATRAGRRGAKTFAHFRIQSERSHPVWATFPFIMSRPLPSDGRITSAALIRRRFARRFIYELQVQIEAPSFERKLMSTAAPVAAINLGWRVQSSGIRVAMVVDEFGNRQELCLANSLLKRLEHSSQIQSVRSRNLQAFKAELRQKLASVSSPPPLVATAMQTLHLWRGAEPFSQFVLLWNKETRNAEEEQVFRFAEEWRRRDLHLLQWLAHERRRAQNHRREIYRLFAAQLARKYSVLLLEDFDLRTVVPRPNVEDPGESQPQRRNRYRAAISTLRKELAYYNRTELEPAFGDTQRCHVCGSNEPFDPAEQLEHRCRNCGAVWDQDVNSCMNKLKRFCERKRLATTVGGPTGIVFDE
jgi:hypothetical protein